MDSTTNFTLDIKHLLFHIIILFLLSSAVQGQQILYDQTDILNKYYTGCPDKFINYKPSIACTDSIRGTLNVLPVYMNIHHNTGYPKGNNDGPAWQGRGLNTTVGFGFSGRYGRLRYVINPMIQYTQNRAFYTGSDLTPEPEFQFPYNNRIDFVARFGPDPYLRFFPGQSEIALEFSKVEVAVSTQNMRWGPSLYHPLMMSANAGGLPHLRLGTSKPLRSKAGKWEGQLFWGTMTESDHFDTEPDNDQRFFSAITLGYEPSFFKGLRLGLNRFVYVQRRYSSGLFQDALMVFSGGAPGEEIIINGNRENDFYDQLASVNLSYTNEAQNLMIYGEFLKGDFNSGFWDLLKQPEHNSGHSIGLEKGMIINSDFTFRVLVEHVSLNAWETNRFRSSWPLYTHGVNRQGYTQRGQLIGSYAGPGSQANVVRVSLHHDRYFIAIDYQRMRSNDDYLNTFIDPVPGLSAPIDFEHQLGLEFFYRFDQFDLRLGALYANRVNYLFVRDRELYNLQSYLTLRYRL